MGRYTLEELINKLNGYLKKAEQTIVDNDVDTRNEIRNELHIYIRATPQKYKFLDYIARDAIRELNEFDLNMATNNIVKIARQLKKQRAIIVLATKKAEDAAEEIQLENLINAINDTTEKLEKFEETAKILDDKETNFSDKISALQKLLTKFQD